MIQTIKKCKKCKGKGVLFNETNDKTLICPECEGTGVPLISQVEEQFNEASELSHTKLYPDDEGYINFEENDYEV